MKNKGSTILVVPIIWTMTILIFLFLILMSVRVMEPLYQKMSETALKYIFIMEEYGYLNKDDQNAIKSELGQKGFDINNIIITGTDEIKEYGEIVELTLTYKHPYKKYKFNSAFFPEYIEEYIDINVHKKGVSKR